MAFSDDMFRFQYAVAVNELKWMNGRSGNDLTHTSVLYLDIIYSKNGLCTSSMIASELNITSPSVIQRVNRLVEMGYVVKRQSEEDRRVMFLSVSEAMLEEYLGYKAFYENVYGELLSEFSESELDVFGKVLCSVREKIGGIGNE